MNDTTWWTLAGVYAGLVFTIVCGEDVWNLVRGLADTAREQTLARYRARRAERKATKAAVERLTALHQIPGWGARMDAQIQMMREDPTLYAQAARIIARREAARDLRA